MSASKDGGGFCAFYAQLEEGVKEEGVRVLQVFERKVAVTPLPFPLNVAFANALH
jgi:hypothetical protein